MASLSIYFNRKGNWTNDQTGSNCSLLNRCEFRSNNAIQFQFGKKHACNVNNTDEIMIRNMDSNGVMWLYSIISIGLYNACI